MHTGLQMKEADLETSGGTRCPTDLHIPYDNARSWFAAAPQWAWQCHRLLNPPPPPPPFSVTRHDVILLLLVLIDAVGNTD